MNLVLAGALACGDPRATRARWTLHGRQSVMTNRREDARLISSIGILAALFLAPLARAQTVKITPNGARTGEYCARDRALLFEDPTEVRILYDPGITVAGGGDTRLGEVDAILVSHNHCDHIGYQRLTQHPDDPNAICGVPPQTTRTGNTTTAEIAAVKNSAVLVNWNMAQFLSRKIENIRGVPTPACYS